ncbi:formate/nitrite transporter family protein [Anianabacter salinae]|uniref:formate/nitrite transporter family protein n=1 Tax=Anianabacter salinae TaxID=2851023 RepID=UPI00225E65B0|nr:formate/nitrite transporter family protein [Anianabacter salinae]MBV0913690.1 formate/nitrite transporter family protein [Anianabacter salinae]
MDQTNFSRADKEIPVADQHNGNNAVDSSTDEKDVQDASRLSAVLIYEVIRRDGVEELHRPVQSLIYSGLAAGIFISLSVLGEAVFRDQLPDTAWRPLVENLGYSFGFLVVILGRMQLFTENTITTVLPVINDFCLRSVGRAAQLWGVVFLSNMVGAFIAAIFIAHTPTFDADFLSTVTQLSEHAVGYDPDVLFFKAIPAGVIVAAIVWMLPSGTAANFFVILTFTWLIAAGDFAHVVAGAVEMAYLVVTGAMPLYDGFAGFLVPVFAGNVVGGTVVFTLLAWGQVKNEVQRR